MTLLCCASWDNCRLIRCKISFSLCWLGLSIKRSAQLTRNKDSFQAGFHSIRPSILWKESDCGRGRNSCQLLASASRVGKTAYCILGDGAMKSKKRHEGMMAGSSSLNV